MNPSSFEMAKEDMAGKEAAPAKEIQHIRVRKAGKGHVIEHHHKHPSHPMEEHVTQGTDGLMSHMMEHMSDPNPGEADADAGNAGMPPAAPDASAAAPPPAGV